MPEHLLFAATGLLVPIVGAFSWWLGTYTQKRKIDDEIYRAVLTVKMEMAQANEKAKDQIINNELGNFLNLITGDRSEKELTSEEFIDEIAKELGQLRRSYVCRESFRHNALSLAVLCYRLSATNEAFYGKGRSPKAAIESQQQQQPTLGAPLPSGGAGALRNADVPLHGTFGDSEFNDFATQTQPPINLI